MSEQPEPARTVAPTRPARVVDVSEDDYRVAINHGWQDGVKQGIRYVIYGLGPELTDPETGESLGRLEIVRGVGTVTHVQERLATLTSLEKAPARRTKIVRRPMGALAGFGATEEETFDNQDNLPFDGVQKGDYARRV